MSMFSTILTYDTGRKRLWIAGQRCHHGATGALITGAAGIGLAVARAHRRAAVAIAATAAGGSLLMAHDWKDRSIWFQRGWQNQP
jgi:hypothetical protein